MIHREDYDNRQDYLDALFRRRRLKFRLLAAVIILAVLGAIGALLSYYKVRNVQVTGNTRYTNEEITEMVTGGLLSDNSLYLSLKYRNKEITNVPFIEQMDVTVITNDTIKITVYEKSLAGYVTYLGSNFYFGRDGKVVESSKEVIDGVPQILGLSFDHIALYEQLPVEDSTIFGRILNVTQLLSKYALSADSIYFDSAGNMTIYFGDIRVAMGGDDYTDEKLSNVAKILPSLNGRGAGTLKMSSYTPSTKYITYVVKDGKATDITAALNGVAVAADAADGTGDAGTADGGVMIGIGNLGTGTGSAVAGGGQAAGVADTTGSANTAGSAAGAAGDGTVSVGTAGTGTTGAATSTGTTAGWESIPETTGGTGQTADAGTGTADNAGTASNTGTADAGAGTGTDGTTADQGTADTVADQGTADDGAGTAEEPVADPVIPAEAEEITP